MLSGTRKFLPEVKLKNSQNQFFRNSTKLFQFLNPDDQASVLSQQDQERERLRIANTLMN